jgi:hypothetical protein
MELDDVKQALSKIEAKSESEEEAHALEDRLFKSFVEEVVRSGDERLRLMAQEVLKSSKIEFQRYYA